MSLGFLFCIPLIVGVFSLIAMRPAVRIGLGLMSFGFMSLCWYQLFKAESTAVMTIGAWPHFAGITWVVDSLSLVFLGIVLLLYLPSYMALRTSSRRMILLFHFLCAALIGSFSTGDIFNLFVMFEVLLLSSYALFFRIQKIQKAKVFIWMNVIASAFFLFALAYTYRALGTVNMADMAIRLQSMPENIQLSIFAIFSFVFLLKAGMFPLFIWMPSSYPSLAPGLLAFIAALGTKVGLYAFIRISTLISPDGLLAFKDTFLILALFTLFVGALAALAHRKLRTSLAYLGMSHLGLMLLAFLLPAPLGLSAMLLYFVHDAIVTAGLFYFCEDHERADSPGLLLRAQPLVTAVFLLLFLSSSGIPPLSGFWPKWLMLQASQFIPLAFISILLSAVLFLYVLLRYWNRLFVGGLGSENKLKLSFSTLYCFSLSLLAIFFMAKQPDMMQNAALTASEKLQYIREVTRVSEATENAREEMRMELVEE
jgi:multicomponent Na+:H+ antiporter subunit D